MNFSKQDKILLINFLDLAISSGINGLSSMNELLQLTTAKDRFLINQIIKIDPKAYGFKGQAIILEAVPSDVVTITNRIEKQSGEYQLDSNTYLPKIIYLSYQKMAKAFQKDYPKRELLTGPSYRSPAFQIITLIYILAKVYDFNLSETLKRVALPQFSQHCSVSRTAIDFLNIDGEPSDEEPEKFRNSVEYDWLTKNAQKYGFYESYPPNNPDGIMPEPWHWQFLEQV